VLALLLSFFVVYIWWQLLHPGESLVQTRRSLDRVKHAGRRPVGPAFLILGAQKSGTTAVYEYLHQVS